MTVEEIAEIPIQDICEKNAASLVWVIRENWVVGLEERA